MITKQQVDGMIERLSVITLQEFENYKILGHPITIGTVLERMKNKGIYCDFSVESNFIMLVHLWGVCGFSRSLQEIVEDSLYFKQWFHCGSCGATECEPCECNEERFEDEFLKNKKASALFEYLLHLFPENND